MCNPRVRANSRADKTDSEAWAQPLLTLLNNHQQSEVSPSLCMTHRETLLTPPFYLTQVTHQTLTIETALMK